LVAEGRFEYGRVDLPALLASDLEDEHIVHVVVVVEPWFCGGVTYALA
jgi:hypothetical protein